METGVTFEKGPKRREPVNRLLGYAMVSAANLGGVWAVTWITKPDVSSGTVWWTGFLLMLLLANVSAIVDKR